MSGSVELAQKGTGNALTTVANAGGTTTTGSTFLVVLIDPNTNTSVSDNKGNTYSLVGTRQAYAGGGSNIAVWKCENGTGGASHIATVTASSGTMDPTMFFISCTGVDAASVDQVAQGTDSATPYTITTGTLSQADELAIAIYAEHFAGGTESWSESTGFTKQVEETNSGSFWTGSAWSLVTSATTALTPSFTDTGGAGARGLFVVTLKAASSATREQEGARFRNDDGSETTATWAASQDSNHTAALSTNLRLRALVNATGDPATGAYTLRYQKNGSGGYVAVPVGATVPEAYGTVTFRSIGTGANGSTTVAPTYPASIASGDYLVCVVTSGATNSETPTTPSGWTLLATGASTDGTYGIDTGPRRVTAFGKIADGTESGTLTVSITNGGTCRGTISRFTKAGSGTWTVTAQGGDDSTSGTGVSITFASMNWNTGDAVLVATGQRVDSATQASQSLTASGVTFGARTNRAATAVTTGNDHRHSVDTFAAVSGTSNVNAAPTWAYTASAAASAGGVIVRLREYTAAVTNEVYVATSANITAGGEATTAQLTAPSGKSTSDFVTGRMWDDENGSDSIDITTDDYTELEWCLQAQSPATNGDYFDFHVYAGAAALDTYTVTPRWTLGSGSTPSSTGPIIQTQARRYAPLQFF